MRRCVAAALALALTLAAALGSFAGCGGRELACPDFDDCTAASDCPLIRCICNGVPVVTPPTCRTDGTCTTTVDCGEVCAAASSTCAVPPSGCGSFIPTECACTDGSTKHYAAAWDCANGIPGQVLQKDCDDTCDNPEPPSSTASVGSSGSASSTGSL